MNFPENIYYTDSHEWVKIDGAIAIIGITEFAQGELGDIVFVDIPELKSVEKGSSIGTIEAVKTVSDIYAPVTGKLIEINSALESSPELINKDCYGEGWMVKIEISNPDEAASLMDASAYRATIGK